VSSPEILVVDDDRNLRSTLEELLISGGYAVRTAANGEEAARMLLEFAPALVLCDWKMPVSGGEQLLESLKRSEEEQPPIIIMTAHGTGPNALRAMELGAYDFVTKPLDADEVLATIARAIKHADL